VGTISGAIVSAGVLIGGDLKKSETWPYWTEEDQHGVTLKFNDFKVLHLPKRYSEGGGLEREYSYALQHLKHLVEAAQIVNGPHISMTTRNDKIEAKMPRVGGWRSSVQITDVVEGESVCDALAKLSEQLKKNGLDHTAAQWNCGYA
jgi:hypothetical protein